MAERVWSLEETLEPLKTNPVSADSAIRESIERLKQTIRDAKRLKKELASQIRELERLKRNKEATRKAKKSGP